MGIAGRIWTPWETNLMKRPAGRGRLASGRVWGNKRITRDSWLMNASCAISIHTTGGLPFLMPATTPKSAVRNPQSAVRFRLFEALLVSERDEKRRISDFGLGIAGRIWTPWETNLMKRPVGRGRLASGRFWGNKRITRDSCLMNANCAISIHTTGGLPFLMPATTPKSEIRNPTLQCGFAHL